jgi:hypothetical protein
MENLIRRAARLLSFGLSESEVRDIMHSNTVTEVELFFAIRAARVLLDSSADRQ